MKILEEKYPKGSLPYQKSDGKYIDTTLKANLDIYAKSIAKDMQFLGLCCSSTFEVRTGKSTFVQQIGEAYTDAVNKFHNLNLTFDMNNIVFKSQDLIKRAFKLKPYSCLILDENDEIDEHYFSQLAKDLRRFFRKSGQLNLFIILIVPNFFQLKSNYAIGRSNFLIDVKFEGEFERGFFDFYSFPNKRDLYIQGKKTQDYRVIKPDFSGAFTNGYSVDKKQYLKAKRKDLEDQEAPEVNEKTITIKLFKQVKNYFEGKISLKELAKCFGVSERTASRWLMRDIEENTKESG